MPQLKKNPPQKIQEFFLEIEIVSWCDQQEMILGAIVLYFLFFLKMQAR